jgi:hypothetical protein
MNRYIEFAQKDIRRLAQDGSLEVRFDDPSSPFYLPRICFMSRGSLPAYSKIRVMEAVMDAKTDLARTAIALEIYRIEKGSYPDNLAALVPGILEKVPEDLFNGKPLLYKLRGGDYLLYSVGPNRTDEGGAQTRDTSHYQDGDLIWGVPVGEGQPVGPGGAAPAAKAPARPPVRGKVKSPGSK